MSVSGVEYKFSTLERDAQSRHEPRPLSISILSDSLPAPRRAAGPVDNNPSPILLPSQELGKALRWRIYRGTLKWGPLFRGLELSPVLEDSGDGGWRGKRGARHLGSPESRESRKEIRGKKNEKRRLHRLKGKESEDICSRIYESAQRIDSITFLPSSGFHLKWKIQTRIANEKYLRTNKEVEWLISGFFRLLHGSKTSQQDSHAAN
ncbi:RIIa domain-containing protein 1 isoform X1 [Pongo abelii]|uniref:RIIa domain-containing protein 1 isoform X1 n=1 Tax=Pongo abelii TaxID=9601 RepID=UPI0023E8FAE8|nr:RIIa domain-containing protein 1 isoform X2 [Pongo abelii]